jgi:hypothetical protein
MSRFEELRSTAQNTQASISNRVDALARLLEEDTERSCVDLRITANVVTAVAKALGPAKALVVSYRLADDVCLAGFEAVVDAWPEKTPMELSRVSEPNRSLTAIFARLKRTDHLYGALVSEYRCNMADAFFRGSAMFQCVWGRHIVECFREVGEEAFSSWLRKMWFVDRNCGIKLTHVLRAAGIDASPDPLRERLLALAEASPRPN